MRGRIALALALLAAAVALAGCGVERTIDPVAAAATKTANAGGVKVAMTVGTTADGKSFTVNANGAFDKDQGELTMDLPGAGGTAEIRYLEESGDPVVYMNMPALSSQLPGGKSWIRLDVAQAGKALGVNVDQLINQAGQNPADVLDMLRASGSVDEIGTETVNGESTTHYKATIDLQKAAGKLGDRAQQAVQNLIAQGAPSALPVDVWVGDDGLVRKLTMDESLSAGGSSAAVNLSILFSDYGSDVNVTAPPADQTLDLTALASQIASAAKAGGFSTH
jgi:hypothetical protein